MIEEKELEQIISKAIEKDLEKQFIRGMVTGWNSCAKALYKKCINLTSAKKIKEVIKEESAKHYDIL